VRGRQDRVVRLGVSGVADGAPCLGEEFGGAVRVVGDGVEAGVEPWSAEAEAPRVGVPKELECASWRRLLVGDGEDIGPRECDLAAAAAGEFPDWLMQVDFAKKVATWFAKDKQ
jgi:hypothetical protein